MKSRGPKNIPIELLRRSSRQTHLSDSQTGLTVVEIKPESIVDRATNKSPNKRKVISSWELTKETKQESDFERQTHTANCHSEVPDGWLELPTDELELERTLLGGQSFRWKKSQDSIFTGVVGNHIWQLWRVSPQRVAFRRLNNKSNHQPINNNSHMSSQILSDYFQLEYKIKHLYKQWASKDPHLSDCSKKYTGFRILKQDPVENVFSFICATNNNIKRISQMIDKLCIRFGTMIELQPTTKSQLTESIYQASYFSFPTIERLAENDVYDCLRNELGFGYRAKFICQTAKQLIETSKSMSFSSPTDYLMALRKMPYKECCKQLMSLPGIGRKVADCICLMSMSHLNAVPIDCHIYKIVCTHYMPELRKDRKTLNDKLHDLIGNYFNELHGELAGWSTSILFVGELAHLKLDKSKSTTTSFQKKESKN